MTSRADALGPSSAFGAARGARSARRHMFEQAMGMETDTPTELPLSAISLNPANPRSDLGDLTQLGASLRDHGQKTAISIMSREAYLAAEPDRAAELDPDTQWVVIEGNSRLAAAREAGLETIKVMVDDTLGSDSDSILESALVANVHRQELAHLDEARALARLLKIHGTQEALAERLHRSQTWVSQRLALLNLTPELQKRLTEGQESADLLKRVGSKKPEEQQEHLDKLKEKRAAARQATKKPKGKPPAPPVERGPDGGANWATPEAFGHAFLGGPPVPQARTSRTDPAEVWPAKPQLTVVGDTEADDKGRGETDGDTGSKVAATTTPAATVSAPEGQDGALIMEQLLLELDDRQRSRLLVRYIQATGRPEALATDLARATRPENRQEVAALLAGAAELLRKSS